MSGGMSSAAAAVSRIQKLFVANVPWTVGNNELRMFFSKYGHVASATVVYDKTCGMSRGYGFVVFSNRNGFTAATQPGTVHSIEGRVLNVQPANS